jgi:adenylate cyclase class 2
MEYEVKIRVASLDPVRERLNALGIPAARGVIERDQYFNSPDRDFGVTDEALRIRSAGRERTLTYKGPKLGSGGIKAREELIAPVGPGETLGEILLRLGFTRTAVVVKQRETYRVEGTYVTLDEVEGLGSFVEIEAPAGMTEPEAAGLITWVRRELGITGEETTLSYLELILATR